MEERVCAFVQSSFRHLAECCSAHHEAAPIGRMTKSSRGRVELACSNAESQEACDHDDDDDDADDVENIH
jgi:hypothetical protein